MKKSKKKRPSTGNKRRKSAKRRLSSGYGRPYTAFKQGKSGMKSKGSR